MRRSGTIRRGECREQPRRRVGRRGRLEREGERHAALAFAPAAPRVAPLGDALADAGEAARELRFVEHDRERGAGGQRRREPAHEAALVLAFGRRGEVEQGDRVRRARRHRERRVVLGAEGDAGRDLEHEARSERLAEQRLQAERRLRRRRAAVGKDDDLRRPAVLQARQALVVRLLERQGKARRAPAGARVGDEREHDARQHDEERERQREQVDPSRRRRPGAAPRRCPRASPRTPRRREWRCRRAATPARAASPRRRARRPA
jgi:hypothetical protein